MKKPAWNSMNTSDFDLVTQLFNVFKSWCHTSNYDIKPELVKMTDSWYMIIVDNDTIDGIWDEFQAALALAQQIKAAG